MTYMFILKSALKLVEEIILLVCFVAFLFYCMCSTKTALLKLFILFK